MDCNCRMHVNLPPEPQAAGMARNALDSVAGEWARPEVLEDARLLVSEIVTNSLRHGHPPTNPHINLSLSLTPERLRAEVCDDGPGFEPKTLRREPEQVGGWGLGIVEKVADRWGVLKGRGICVWFEIDNPVPSYDATPRSLFAKI